MSTAWRAFVPSDGRGWYTGLDGCVLYVWYSEEGLAVCSDLCTPIVMCCMVGCCGHFYLPALHFQVFHQESQLTEALRDTL